MSSALGAPIMHHPVAVGGVGGSGTRLVSQILQALGIYLGDDLNDSLDTLWFTLLYKRIEILDCDDAEFDAVTDVFVTALSGAHSIELATLEHVCKLTCYERPQQPIDWLEQRVDSLKRAVMMPRPAMFWGWKEPNTHVVIEQLWQRMPALRYIHVVRHGIDMAYSKNQNQLKFWGGHVLSENGLVTPRKSLAYWCRVHERMLRLLRQNQERMFWLDYDELCRNPSHEIGRLLAFLGLEPAMAQKLDLDIRPQPPRYLHAAGLDFDSKDIAFVKSLGYEVAFGP